MKQPFPTTRGGLILSPYEIGYTTPGEGAKFNIHHGYWPWPMMNTGFITRTFGSLVTNTFRMIPSEHNVGRYCLHAEYGPPRLPSLSTMVEVVDEYLDANGQVDCVNHSSTRELYIVTAEQWRRGAHGIQELDRPRD